MAVAKQFQQLVKITNGTTAETDVKLSDPLAMQHIDISSGANSLNQISLAQSMCQPVAVTPNSTPSGGAYTATCSNYPDFSLTYTDKNGNTHYLVGMKVRVIFTKGITYGSVSGGTYPTLNINSSGAIPLLAQGKTMAAGAAVDGQSLELTLIPYGNGVAWDADSNVRESTSDYTIYTDGSIKYNGKKAPYSNEGSNTVSSFQELTGQGSVNSAAVADYIRTYISNYSNGSVFIKDLGGPSYQGIVYKFSNNYFTIFICGYSTQGGIETFTYSNGLYLYKKIA